MDPGIEEAELCVDVTIERPRRSNRPLDELGSREAETATDFDASIAIRYLSCPPWLLRASYRSLEQSYEGTITLHRLLGAWEPISSRGNPEREWTRGRLRDALDRIRALGTAMSVDVALRVTGEISGAGWAAPPAPAPAPELIRRSFDLRRNAIIPGDVVRHTNTRRIGTVVETGRIHPDGTVEYHARPIGDESCELTWWNSARVRRLAWSEMCKNRGRVDPYRKYLDMVAAEDAPAKRGRREDHRRSRGGPDLARDLWDRAYWRIVNLQRFEPGGGLAYHDLGRERWSAAANDCLDRRDRAERSSWARAERRAHARPRPEADERTTEYEEEDS